MAKLQESIRNFASKTFVKIKAAEDKFLHSHYLIFIIPILLLLLAFLFYTPFLFNAKDLRFQVEQKISQHLKANLEIKGEVRIHLVPQPSISIEDVILKNYRHSNKNYNIFIKHADLNLSFLASLIAKFKIKEIAIQDAFIEIQNAQDANEIKSFELKQIIAALIDKRNQEGIAGNIFPIGKFSPQSFNLTNFPDLSLQNVKITSYSKLENTREINNFSGDFSFSKNAISGQGNFAIGANQNNFAINLKLQKNSGSTIELNSSYSNLKISGGFNDKDFKGIAQGEIFNLKEFYKSYIADSGFVYEKINGNIKSIKLKSDIAFTDNEISINNIAVSSNLMNGKGEIYINNSFDVPLIDVRLDMENLNMDEIWISDKKFNAAQEKKSDNQPQTTQNQIQSAIDLGKDLRDFDLTIETKINRVRYLAEEIKNVDLYITVSKQGQILILPLNFEVPGQGELRIKGAIENRNNSPKFIGKIDVKGKKLADTLRWLGIKSQNLKYDNLNEYAIYSDLMLMPNITVFNNFYLNINNQNTELLGEMRIDYFSKNPNIISNFGVHNLDIDDYFLTSGQNSYFSAGDLLKKTLWLNGLSSNHDMTLNFDQLRYKNLTFNDQMLKMRFGSGYFNIDSLRLESQNFDIDLAMALDLKEAKPRFNLSLKSKNFLYQAPQNQESQAAQTEYQSFADQIFSLPSLENFSGNLLFEIDNADFDNFNAKNLRIGGRMHDGIIDFADFSAKIYDGNFKFAGSAAIKFEKSLSGNIELTNAKIKPLLLDFTNQKINTIDGVTNLASSFSSFGENKNHFFKNITSESKFSAIDLEIAHFGLNELVKKMFNPFYFQADLEDPMAVLYDKSASTKIDKASGIFAIDKGRDNRLKADFSGLAFNGVMSTKFDLIEEKIDGSYNIIFLSGNRKKQVPINIASNFKGNFSEILHSANIDQAIQYIKMAKQYISRGATEVKFKEEAAATAQNNEPSQEPQAPELPKEMQNLNLNLSKEQMQMIETSFPNGVVNLEQQLQEQGIETQQINSYEPKN